MFLQTTLRNIIYCFVSYCLIIGHCVTKVCIRVCSHSSASMCERVYTHATQFCTCNFYILFRHIANDSDENCDMLLLTMLLIRFRSTLLELT
uniref:Uncharacterized protein n=1 Tax=Octopus bimaculoides TaxID=37653 RepID=A0A0L8HQB3_OCTBM